MPIYKVKGSPYWWYDFTIQGQRHRGSTQTAKRAEAEAIYAKRRSEAVLGNFYDASKQILLSAAFDRYEDERAKFTKSYKSIQAHIDHMVKYFGEGKMLHQIGMAELTAYIAFSRTEINPRTGKPHSPAIVNRRLATFQGMHNDARLIHNMEVKNIDFRKLKLKEPPPINNTLTRAKFKELYDISPPYIQDYLMFAVYSGLRMSNILTLKGEQINMENLTITTIGKGGKAIVVSIVGALASHILDRGLHKKKWVITRKGEPVESIKTTWATLCKKAGLKGFRRHDLRHTCATWIYEDSGDLLMVKEHLHHSDIKTSMRYTHTKTDTRREKLNRALNPKPINLVK